MLPSGLFGPACKEAGKTVRAAIGGWGPTLRLIAIMTAATVSILAIIAFT